MNVHLDWRRDLDCTTSCSENRRLVEREQLSSETCWIRTSVTILVAAQLTAFPATKHVRRGRAFLVEGGAKPIPLRAVGQASRFLNGCYCLRTEAIQLLATGPADELRSVSAMGSPLLLLPPIEAGRPMRQFFDDFF